MFAGFLKKIIMKKILGAIVGVISVAALFLGCAENLDGSCDVLWTVGCFVVSVLFGWLYGAYFCPKPIHIPLEAYFELQGQIQHAVDTIEEEKKTIDISADLPDDALIHLTIEMRTHTSSTKFKDEAWGAVKMFKETHWVCECEITFVEVLDKFDKRRRSDFDKSNLDLEFEVTDWQ